MDGSTRPVPRTSTRRTDLDLLRIIVCAGVILGHALLIYAAEPRYHLKAPTEWVPATVLYEAIRITSLPIFFCLAGWSAVGSLRRRDARRYVKDRLLRVLLPLFAGVLLLGPIIKWIELQQGRDLRLGGFRLVPPPEYSFVEFLGRYLTRVDTMTWSHLWFLAYLFVISLILLPALRWCKAGNAAPRRAHPAPSLCMRCRCGSRVRDREGTASLAGRGRARAAAAGQAG